MEPDGIGFYVTTYRRIVISEGVLIGAAPDAGDLTREAQIVGEGRGSLRIRVGCFDAERPREPSPHEGVVAWPDNPAGRIYLVGYDVVDRYR